MPKKKKSRKYFVLPGRNSQAMFAQAVSLYTVAICREFAIYIFLIGSCFSRPIDRKLSTSKNILILISHKITKFHSRSTKIRTEYINVYAYFVSGLIFRNENCQALRMEKKKKYMRNILILPFIRLVHALSAVTPFNERI